MELEKLHGEGHAAGLQRDEKLVKDSSEAALKAIKRINSDIGDADKLINEIKTK
jgi:hypothetical protein